VYAWRSPGSIGGCHGVDEFPDLRTRSGSAGLFRLG
jgi:hypothetical protein